MIKAHKQCDPELHGFSGSVLLCLVMKRPKTEAAGSVLKCVEIYSLLRFSQTQQS